MCKYEPRHYCIYEGKRELVIMAIDENTKRYVLELYFPDKPKNRISVSRIINKLNQENKVEQDKAKAEGKKKWDDLKWKTPSPRTIYNWIAEAKGRIPEGMEDEYKPWSILLSDKASIPFDPVLIKLLRFWFERQIRRGESHPFVPFSVGIAKWAVRLHKMAPFLVEEGEQQLLYRARQYFNMERIDILTAGEPDSSYDDLEIAIKDPDTDPKVKADYDQFFGVKGLVIQDTEVSPDIVTKKIKTEKNRRKRK